MADGLPTSQSQTETWREYRPQISETLLSQSNFSTLPSQSFTQTSCIDRKRTAGAVVQTSPGSLDPFEDDSFSRRKPSRREHRIDDHEAKDHCSTALETPDMVESPAGSLRERYDHNSVSRSRPPRGVTYTSSTSSHPDSHHEPLRQDSTYFSTRGSHEDDLPDFDSDVAEEELRARERVVVLRRRVWKTRQIKRQNRDSLGQLRENTRSTLDRLTQKINELFALNKFQGEIGQYYEEFRAARDELGPAEHEFDRLENRLENEEQDLEDEEEHYYDLFRYKRPPVASIRGSSVAQTVSSATKPYDNQDETKALDLNSNLLQEYLSKIDEARALGQELQNLEDDYYRVSEDANLRRRNGFALFTTMSTFLSDYPSSRAEILDTLYRVEESIFDLRDECIKQGIFSKDDYRYEPRDALRDELMNAVDEARDRSPLRVAAQHVKHPAETKQLNANKKNYVNRWLLDWVQESTVDMMMLRTFIYINCPGISETPHKTLVEIGDDRWTDFSLRNWYTDEAGDTADQNFNASRFDKIAGDTNILNVGSTQWSRYSDSLRSSLLMGPNYDPSIDLDLMESEHVSTVAHSNELDALPTELKSGDREKTATFLDVTEVSHETQNNQNNSDVSSVSVTSLPHSTDTAVQNSSVASLPRIMSYGPNPPPHIDEPEQILIPDTSTNTSRPPSSMKNNTNSITSLAPSEESTRTSFETIEHHVSKWSLSPNIPYPQPSRPKTPEASPSRSRFLDAPKSSLSRSSSLNAPKRQTHHLSRRSLDFLLTQSALHPTIRKSASFSRA